MTNEEKILFVYNRIRDIDSEIIAMNYENKSEEDALAYTNLASGKTALIQELRNLGVNVD